ncbi:MAG: thioredoxin [Bacillota bacterium]|nr:thioredoxin [Bacillota bacterium]
MEVLTRAKLKQETEKLRRMGMAEKHVVLTDENFDSKISELKGDVLVDFWAPWCGRCRMLSPVIDEVAADYDGRLTVAKVNTDENQEVSAKYRIMSIPTLILFKGGKPAERLVGYMSKKDLKRRIDSLIQ